MHLDLVVKDEAESDKVVNGNFSEVLCQIWLANRVAVKDIKENEKTGQNQDFQDLTKLTANMTSDSLTGIAQRRNDLL